MIFVLGVFLSEHQSAWLTAGLAVLVAVATSAVVAVSLGRSYLRLTKVLVERMASSLTQRIEDIGHAALIRAEARDGLTQDRLSEYESRIDVQTIWIVGSNFDNEVRREAPFLKVVRRNIHQRHVKYVYIAPDSKILRRKFSQLRDELDLEPADPRLQTIFVPAERWQEMPYTAGNFTIYDPERKGHAPQAFCWDPGGDGNSFIELKHKVDDWIAEIQTVCPGLENDHATPTTADAAVTSESTATSNATAVDGHGATTTTSGESDVDTDRGSGLPSA